MKVVLEIFWALTKLLTISFLIVLIPSLMIRWLLTL